MRRGFFSMYLRFLVHLLANLAVLAGKLSGSYMAYATFIEVGVPFCLLWASGNQRIYYTGIISGVIFPSSLLTTSKRS